MKQYKVYKLINRKTEKVEYVGSTKDPDQRFKDHKYRKSRNGGRFAGNENIEMIIVTSFETKKEAVSYEINLQRYYGFIDENAKKALKMIGTKNPNSKVSENTIMEIKTLIGEGLTNSEISKKVNLSIQYISSIRCKKRRLIL